MAGSFVQPGRYNNQPVGYEIADPRWLNHGPVAGNTRSIIWSAGYANTQEVFDAGNTGISGPLTGITLTGDKIGTGFNCNGSSSKIELATSTVDTLPFTCLFYGNITSVAADRGLVSHRPSSGWVWAARTSGTYQVYDGGGWKDSLLTAKLGAPVMAGLTVDAASNLIFYQNGVASAQIASALAITNGNIYTVGAWDSSFGNFLGTIYYAAYIPRMYTPGEMSMLAANPWALFAPKQRRFYVGAAAGNTYNVSLADVMSILDAQSAAAIFAPSIAESFAIADAPSAVMTTNATLAESLTLTDSATAAMIAAASIAESLAMSDAPSATAMFAASVAETLIIADAPSATAVMNVSVVEVMALSDAPNTGGQASAVSVGESLAFTDAYTATVIFAGTIAESLALTDAPSATAIWNAVIAEVAALSDLPSATAVMGATITEVMGFTDAPSAAGVSVLTTDPWYVARAAGRTFIVSAAGRTFVVRSGGR